TEASPPLPDPPQRHFALGSRFPPLACSKTSSQSRIKPVQSRASHSQQIARLPPLPSAVGLVVAAGTWEGKRSFQRQLPQPGNRRAGSSETRKRSEGAAEWDNGFLFRFPGPSGASSILPGFPPAPRTGDKRP